MATDDPSTETDPHVLEKYCRNLTTLAKEGKLDPVIGRDEEIRRTIQVLSRRTKNNPMLIGEPGVGKTAIAEGLAHRIIQGDVPDSLKGKQLFALDMGALLPAPNTGESLRSASREFRRNREKPRANALLYRRGAYVSRSGSDRRGDGCGESS